MYILLQKASLVTRKNSLRIFGQRWKMGQPFYHHHQLDHQRNQICHTWTAHARDMKHMIFYLH